MEDLSVKDVLENVEFGTRVRIMNEDGGMIAAFVQTHDIADKPHLARPLSSITVRTVFDEIGEVTPVLVIVAAGDE